MKNYIIWACEKIIKDMLSGFDPDIAWELAMTYITTHDLSDSKYSIKKYLEEVK
jgi:hypothetical protein